jgi:hypothetical protein
VRIRVCYAVIGRELPDRPGELRPLVRARKAVFVVEYELAPLSFCARANRAGFMAMRKRFELGAWRRPCWARQ